LGEIFGAALLHPGFDLTGGRDWVDGHAPRRKEAEFGFELVRDPALFEAALTGDGGEFG